MNHWKNWVTGFIVAIIALFFFWAFYTVTTEEGCLEIPDDKLNDKSWSAKYCDPPKCIENCDDRMR